MVLTDRTSPTESTNKGGDEVLNSLSTSAEHVLYVSTSLLPFKTETYKNNKDPNSEILKHHLASSPFSDMALGTTGVRKTIV